MSSRGLSHPSEVPKSFEDFPKMVIRLCEESNVLTRDDQLLWHDKHRFSDASLELLVSDDG